MDVTLTPTKLNGTINARASAISANLHQIARSLADPGAREAVAHYPEPLFEMGLNSSDQEAMLRCLPALSTPDELLNCGSSLSTLLTLLPIAAAKRSRSAFVGSEALADAGLEPVREVMEKFGTKLSRGSLKIRRRDRKKFTEICSLSGGLSYGHFSLTGKEDPRFVSGLLFAMPLLEGNSTMRMTTLPPTTELADMTIDLMRQYGISASSFVDEYGYPYYEIPGNQKYRLPTGFQVEGDWNLASFFLCCGALGGNVTLRGLRSDSAQCSRQILDKFHSMGAGAGIGEDGANVTAANLNASNINIGRTPQLLPALAITMASASGTSMLTDLGDIDPEPVLQILEMLGADISRDGERIIFKGKSILTGGVVDAGNDPMKVLVAAAASCICSEPVSILDAGIVNKYYPDFFRDFAALGGRVRVTR